MPITCPAYAGFELRIALKKDFFVSVCSPNTCVTLLQGAVVEKIIKKWLPATANNVLPARSSCRSLSRVSTTGECASTSLGSFKFLFVSLCNSFLQPLYVQRTLTDPWLVMCPEHKLMWVATYMLLHVTTWHWLTTFFNAISSPYASVVRQLGTTPTTAFEIPSATAALENVPLDWLGLQEVVHGHRKYPIMKLAENY